MTPRDVISNQAVLNAFPSEMVNDSRHFIDVRANPFPTLDCRRVTESNPKGWPVFRSSCTSGRGSGLVKPLRFGISTLGSEVALRTVSSVTMLFR